jgi:ribosomal protein S18 acetylase RimI-like enzyme
VTVLRQATVADAPDVARVLIDVRQVFMPYAPSAHSASEVRAWVASDLLPSGTVTVAECGGRVVGLIAAGHSDQASWITQLAVEPATVGQGVGSTLLQHALRKLPLPIRLYTFQANAGARRFFERHGFAAREFTDGCDNAERCPDVLYELNT